MVLPLFVLFSETWLMSNFFVIECANFAHFRSLYRDEAKDGLARPGAPSFGALLLLDSHY